MNCVACGNQLPAGAAACPRCGTLAPSYFTDSGATPYDPTIAASPRNDAPGGGSVPATAYGLDPYSNNNVPPPPGYQPPQYNVQLPPYPQTGPGSQQNVPGGYYTPPPMLKPKKNRTGLVIGLVLLTVLIVGGGIVAFAAAGANNHPTGPTADQLAATATAQAKAQAEQNPYLPGKGTLVMSDPMTDNSQGNKWDEATMNDNNGNISGTCGFQTHTYHLTKTEAGSLVCDPEAPKLTFDNLTYEAKLTMTKADYVGIMFRFDQAKGTGYLFTVGVQGDYAIDTVNFNDSKNEYKSLKSGTNSNIKKGVGQTNVLGVVVNGTTIKAYVNGTYIESVIDSSFTTGQVGVYGYIQKGPMDVVAADARVWQL